MSSRAVAAAKCPDDAAGRLSKEEGQVLGRLLRWPAVCLFPALDIARMFALNRPVASDLAGSIGTFSAAASGMPYPRTAVVTCLGCLIALLWIPIYMHEIVMELCMT